nr:MAG TPA: hypothetical protein [Caudoviricetes sp.]
MKAKSFGKYWCFNSWIWIIITFILYLNLK